MPEGRVLTLSCSEERLECLVRIELKVGDSDAGVCQEEKAMTLLLRVEGNTDVLLMLFSSL